MAKAAVKARELKHFEDGQKPLEEKRKAKERVRRLGPETFKGKIFAKLTEGEKDELLKTLAIAAGLVLE